MPARRDWIGTLAFRARGSARLALPSDVLDLVAHRAQNLSAETRKIIQIGHCTEADLT